jgi:UDP-N-acetylglucosamine/UDP-N-acetylgalactosamine diphosphorylase
LTFREMTVRERVQKAGQEQVFKFFDNLSKAEQEKLEADVASLPIEDLERVFKASQTYEGPDVAGCKAVNADRTGVASKDDGTWFKKGLELVSESKLAVVLLAGGQGTRLGVAYPKGMYNIGLPSGKSLFQVRSSTFPAV